MEYGADGSVKPGLMSLVHMVSFAHSSCYKVAGVAGVAGVHAWSRGTQPATGLARQWWRQTGC
jgi:hypothetical protein